MQQRHNLQKRIEQSFRPVLMDQMRQLMGAERQSQQIVDRMQQLEDQISQVAKRSKTIALKRYILGLLQVKYGNYNETVQGMNCAVC